ncbi:class I SAM-dependent methyltransferase [Flavilitoribacter nigricans]|uniref:Uncharacterized protein n=1 Tax=Flavilitoribacter nigricans (strain ATCC 23147 / DSM 23189 / NBRC 102662 / NCIMB 1420 / SS-2) TaxID=1122177 RepID=A0A2D0MZZ0_FLAN2|nr:hypothetical protein [Flavilitoribacter nigricans]PHN01469.1 hypothetical protein CRP01_36825 [Flavilitoribacter nigricans DSM 23189 = NBRC 102662]
MDIQPLEQLIKKLELNPQERSGHIYHPIPFPEFNHLTVSSNHKEVYKKWDKILDTSNQLFGYDLSGKKVLDIGANAGFYSFNFVKQGAKVTAFEPHQVYSEIAAAIIHHKKLSSSIWWRNGVYDRNVELPAAEFDIGLLLSTYQWMAAGGENMEYATESLRDISTKVRYLFFELGYNHGNSHLKSPKFNHYAYLIRHLRMHTRYRYFKLIGKTRLWKNNTRYLMLCSNDPKWDDHFLRRIISRIHI